MRQQNFRAAGWIATIVVWSSCLPMAFACDASGFVSGDCSFSQSTMIGLIIGGVALVFFIIVCSVFVRRRRARSQVGRIGRVSNIRYNDMEAHTLTPQKPWNAPVAYGYPAYSQPSPPVSWSAPAPRYPPPTHDTQYNGLRSEMGSQWSSPTTFYPMPEPSTPTSPLSTRTSSSPITSRPTPSIDTTPASLRPTVQRDEATRMRPQPSSTSLAPRSPQNNVTDTPLPAVPSFPRVPQAIVIESSSTPASSSLAPQSQQKPVTQSSLPSVSTSPLSRRPIANIPPPASPQQPSTITPQLHPPPPIVLSPMATGATSNVAEPPPPYTPI